MVRIVVRVLSEGRHFHLCGQQSHYGSAFLMIHQKASEYAVSGLIFSVDADSCVKIVGTWIPRRKDIKGWSLQV